MVWSHYFVVLSLFLAAEVALCPRRLLVTPGSLLRPPGTPLTHGMSFLTKPSHPVSLLIRSEKLTCHKGQPGPVAQCDTVHFLGGWLLWAPGNILKQNFVFTVLFGHYLDPLNHWNHIHHFLEQGWICAFKCTIDWTPKHMVYMVNKYKWCVSSIFHRVINKYMISI